MGWAGFNHCHPGIESRWEVIKGETTPAHTETAEHFTSIISPHITSLSPLQKSTAFANLLITNPVSYLSPGPPHPLLLAGTCPAPLPYMNLVCCFFLIVGFFENMHAFPPHSLPVSSSSVTALSLLHSTGVCSLSISSQPV